MKKLTLIISALALVILLSQCTKKPNLPSWNGNTQTVEFTTSHNGGAKGELFDATTILNYKWDINDEDENGKTDMLYVYAQPDGTTFSEGVFVGTLPIVEVSADGYDATFRARLDIPASGVLRFVHYGQGVDVDENGVASVDFSNQKGTLEEISKYVVAKCDRSYTGNPIFNGCLLEVQFAIAKLQFSGFGSGNITVRGMEATGLNIATTGIISNNTNTSSTLKTPGTNNFFTVFMPKGSSTYEFCSSVAVADVENWEFVANKYYTKNNGSGDPTGEPKVVEKENDPSFLPGEFTVGPNAGDKVHFSRGNLWYGTATSKDAAAFHFESNQWDYANLWNTNHVSHFFWSNTTDWQTSGKEPYASSYAFGTRTTTDVFFTNATETTPSSTFTVDGQSNKWRILSCDEWNYLVGYDPVAGTQTETYGRANAKSLCKWVQLAVSGKSIYGMVILPDGDAPSPMIPSPIDETYLTSNDAVFLPAVGNRTATTVEGVNTDIFYWSSTPNADDVAKARSLQFYVACPITGDNYRYYGNCVRLVQ